MVMTDTHAATLVHVEPKDLDRERMHPLVHAALATGQPLDPDTLKKLMDLQERYDANVARKAYTRAIAALKADLPTVIAKDAIVDYTSRKTGEQTYYKHASLAGVMDAVTGALTQYGFSLSWTPASAEKSVRVTCRLQHVDGHYEEATLEAPADNSGNKSPAQAIMSTITLLERYTALAILGIATAEMKEETGEPAPEPDDHVDAKRNMSAMKAITTAKRSIKQAEKLAGGRPASQWTKADRVAIKAWLGQSAPAPEPETIDTIDGELVDDGREFADD